MAEKEEPVYIGIESPAEVRRAILESSKSLIRILQMNESIKEKKRQKHYLVTELGGIMNELSSLLSQLKLQLPRIRMSSLPKRHAEKPIIQDKAAKQAIKQMAPPKPKLAHLTEPQKLEKELQDIEEKLKSL